MATYVDIKPEILRWAVDRSGLPLDEYQPTVAAWLTGRKKPTYSQLETFARRAMVPFGYLFLQQPPDEELPLPDYRTRKDQGVRRPTPNLIETIFEMQRRQDWMREYLLDEGHAELPFVGSANVGEKITPLTQRIRKALGLADEWAEQQANWEDALRFLREQIEEAGILNFVNGVVVRNGSDGSGELKMGPAVPRPARSVRMTAARRDRLRLRAYPRTPKNACIAARCELANCMILSHSKNRLAAHFLFRASPATLLWCEAPHPRMRPIPRQCEPCLFLEN